MAVVKAGTTKKFTSQWRGPYTVLDRINKVNYRITLIESPAKPLVVHHNRLKLCYGTPQQVTTPASQPSLNIQNQNRPFYSEIVQSTSPTVGGYTAPPNDPTTAAPNVTTPNVTTTATPNITTADISTTTATTYTPPTSSTTLPPNSSATSSSSTRPQYQRRPPARYNDFVAP